MGGGCGGVLPAKREGKEKNLKTTRNFSLSCAQARGMESHFIKKTVEGQKMRSQFDSERREGKRQGLNGKL